MVADDDLYCDVMVNERHYYFYDSYHLNDTDCDDDVDVDLKNEMVIMDDNYYDDADGYVHCYCHACFYH